ncbi:autotransporter outer membrane beta-barrel domain-containing protein [Pseudomonas japonica]|uniref:autotransporter outer membrane beta-barrel domain-containing protein n=1 Tax=Pseudomonas japonica TaxID=256466 RepID=UPI0015E2D3DD|nr:autotransporter outer membrane beta-barrel domain-containing protein [Pseudomonas japonica]MBA1291672.1 autotransporter domain-containing protein [Pseudomonas japonica]
MDIRSPGQPLQSAVLRRTSPSFVFAPQHLAVAVVLAMGCLSSEYASASGSCTTTSSVISGPTSTACILDDNGRVRVTETGSIEVDIGASIRGAGAFARQIDNAGSLRGDSGIALDGGSLSGRLYNASTGVIQGASGIVITNIQIAGSLTNAGAIVANGGSGIRADNVGVAGNILNSGRIQVNDGDHGLAVLNSSVTGSISNSGEIIGGGDTLLVQNSFVDGSIRNSGTIDSTSHPLLITGGLVGGDVINSGTLDGATHLEDGQINGRFVNSGTMSSGITALTITGMTIQGGIVNTGHINSGSGVSIYNSRLGSFSNSGTLYVSSGDLGLVNNVITGSVVNTGRISSGTDGFGALSIYGGAVGTDVNNAGTLDGGFLGVALRTDRDALIFGDVLNSGRMTGATAVLLNMTRIGGSFINTGKITGNVRTTEHRGSGVIMTRSSIDDDFINKGRIEGLTRAVLLDGVTLKGSLNNSGTLNAAQGALELINTKVGGAFINTGAISTNLNADKDPDDYDATSRGVKIGGSTITGQVVNKGTVRGNAIGLEVLDSTLSAGLVNNGLFKGADYSLYISDDSTVKALYIGGANTARFAGAVYAPNTTAYVYSNATYTLLPGDRWTVDSLTNRGTLVLGAPAKRGTVATVTGDYVQPSGGVLRTEVTDATHYGQLVVSGTATLPSQARINVDVAKANQPFTVSRLQDVIKAGTLKSNGTFAVTSNSALFNFGAVKDANTVDLTLAAKTSSGVGVAASEAGLTGASGAARVLDQQLALGSASALTPYFVSATSNAEVASRLAQTLPQTNASLRASQAALSAIGLAVQERMGIANGLLSADGLNNAPGLWSKPFSYASGRTGGSSGSVIGMDTRLSSTSRAGFAFAYANAETANVQGAAQSSQLDLWQFLGYRSYALDRTTELMLYAGAGNNSVQGERTLALSGVSGTAKGDYDSVIATVGASLGRTLQLSDTTQLLPALRLDFNHIRDEAYREHGSSGLAPLLLNVEERNSNQLIAGMDGTLAHAFTPHTALKLNLGVGYDLINDNGAVKAAFAGAPDQAFTTAGDKASPWLWRSGAGLATTFSNGAELSVNYDAQTRSDYTDQTASVKFSLPF